MKSNFKKKAKNFVYHRLDIRHKVALCSIRKTKLATRGEHVVGTCNAGAEKP